MKDQNCNFKPPHSSRLLFHLLMSSVDCKEPPESMSIIEFVILGCGIRVECMDSRAELLLLSVYGSFRQSAADARIHYRITRQQASGRLLIARQGACPMVARDDYEFLYVFEKDMIIEIQKLRADLYFVHSAIVELHGHALALVAPSGYGKSTTTWALLHHGFRYASDELAPIELTSMQVHPFPHALCLKSIPSIDYPLPQKAIYTTRTVHIPTNHLPTSTVLDMMSLDAVFFVRFDTEIAAPVLKPIAKADAVVRLFTNALNPLAHRGDGLDAAIEIVSRVRSFELLSSELAETCELIKSTFAPAVSTQKNRSRSFEIPV
jgi:hypothetical protein